MRFSLKHWLRQRRKPWSRVFYKAFRQCRGEHKHSVLPAASCAPVRGTTLSARWFADPDYYNPDIWAEGWTRIKG